MVFTVTWMSHCVHSIVILMCGGGACW